MEIVEKALDGLLVLRPTIFGDERGYFYESFNQKVFQKLSGSETKFVQDNQSLSHRGVLRGMHFQAPPYAQAKLVRVISGSVMDVVVDIRKNSAHYGKHFSIELSAINQLQLFIPDGFAHGFLTLQDNTVFAYKCSEYYNRGAEGSLYWNDPALQIRWNFDQPNVSEKDSIKSDFSVFDSPFR